MRCDGTVGRRRSTARTAGRSPRRCPCSWDPERQAPQVLATYPSTFTMTMGDGTWHLRHRAVDGDWDDGGGSYTVEGDQVVFDWHGSLLTFTFTVDADGSLHLEPQPPMDPGDQFIWTTNPWTKIADDDGSSDAAAAKPAGRHIPVDDHQRRRARPRTAGRQEAGEPGDVPVGVHDDDERWNMGTPAPRRRG